MLARLMIERQQPGRRLWDYPLYSSTNVRTDYAQMAWAAAAKYVVVNFASKGDR
jgi:hypothetical protein